MDDAFTTIQTESQTEIKVRASRFIGETFLVTSVDEAVHRLNDVRKREFRANHHCYAYVLGRPEPTEFKFSDAGEPSGTAGRPALAVLRGSGLGDVVVVVTRYFGGTKLGTGGLVRAYGDAVRRVLESVSLAEKVSTRTLQQTVPYNLLEQCRSLVVAHGGRILDEEFAAEVTVTAQFRALSAPKFQGAMQELSHGRVSVQLVKTDEATIFPLDEDVDNQAGN